MLSWGCAYINRPGRGGAAGQGTGAAPATRIVYWFVILCYVAAILLIRGERQELSAKIITGVGVVLWVAYCNSNPYRLTFPGLTLYYPNQQPQTYGLVKLEETVSVRPPDRRGRQLTRRDPRPVEGPLREWEH